MSTPASGHPGQLQFDAADLDNASSGAGERPLCKGRRAHFVDSLTGVKARVYVVSTKPVSDETDDGHSDTSEDLYLGGGSGVAKMHPFKLYLSPPISFNGFDANTTGATVLTLPQLFDYSGVQRIWAALDRGETVSITGTNIPAGCEVQEISNWDITDPDITLTLSTPTLGEVTAATVVCASAAWTFRVRTGRYRECGVAATDNQDWNLEDPSAIPMGNNEFWDITCSTTAKTRFWIEFMDGATEGTHLAWLRWGIDPAASSGPTSPFTGDPFWTAIHPWTSFPNPDEHHRLIGEVTVNVTGTWPLVDVRQLRRDDLEDQELGVGISVDTVTVTDITNADYLECLAGDGVTPVNVAKPVTLRGSATIVVQPYAVDDVLTVIKAPYLGLTDGDDEPIEWIDLNVDGRQLGREFRFRNSDDECAVYKCNVAMTQPEKVT